MHICGMRQRTTLSCAAQAEGVRSSSETFLVHKEGAVPVRRVNVVIPGRLEPFKSKLIVIRVKDSLPHIVKFPHSFRFYFCSPVHKSVTSFPPLPFGSPFSLRFAPTYLVFYPLSPYSPPYHFVVPHFYLILAPFSLHWTLLLHSFQSIATLLSPHSHCVAPLCHIVFYPFLPNSPPSHFVGPLLSCFQSTAT